MQEKSLPFPAPFKPKPFFCNILLLITPSFPALARNTFSRWCCLKSQRRWEGNQGVGHSLLLSLKTPPFPALARNTFSRWCSLKSQGRWEGDQGVGAFDEFLPKGTRVSPAYSFLQRGKVSCSARKFDTPLFHNLKILAKESFLQSFH